MDSAMIKATPKLNIRDTNKLLKRMERDLKHPVGPVATPKLHKAVRMIRQRHEQLSNRYR